MKKKSRATFGLASQIAAVLLVLVFISVFGGSGCTQKVADKTTYPRPYLETVRRYAYKYGVDENLVFAIIKAESNFDPLATSRAGALGLMQIMPETFEGDIKHRLSMQELSSDALYNPETNIQCGVYYFSRWYTYFGSVSKALAAYNAGPGKVLGWLENPEYTDGAGELATEKIPYQETRKYVALINRYYEKYTELYGDERTGSRICERAEILAYAKKYGEKYKVDYNLIMAIAETESGLRECEISSSGALGMMQIKPDTYKVDIAANLDLDEEADSLLSAEFAVMCGAYYIHWLDGYLDGIYNISAAYNGGINTVRSWLAGGEYSADGRLVHEKIPDETVKRYVEKVMRYYEKSVLADGRDEIYKFEF